MDRQHYASRALAVLFLVSFALASATCLAKTGKTHKEDSKSADSEVAATVGDHTFTMAEVDAKASAANAQLFQQLYTARRQAVDELIANYVIDLEAKARGISRDELVAQEATSKVVPASDEEVSAFYEQNKAQMRGASLDVMKPQIQAYLNNRRNSEAYQAFVDGLKAKQAVKIALSPPRTEVQIAANDPRKGPDSAPVRIIEFSDFQ